MKCGRECQEGQCQGQSEILTSPFWTGGKIGVNEVSIEAGMLIVMILLVKEGAIM